LSVTGCSKAPPVAPVHQLAKEEAEQPLNPPSTAPADSPANVENPGSPLPREPVATLEFSNPATAQAWNQYVDSFEAVRSVPAPPFLSEPSAIAAHIAEVNRRLEVLQQSRSALIRSLTSPEDKKRFQAAEKSFINDQDQ
jgi:hypothetical protein